MHTRHELSRITIDLPKASHKKLKAVAAIMGKSMRELVLESIEEHLYSEHKPNQKTQRALRNAEKKKGAVVAKSAEDLFKKLGI
jgi:antitoxin component of RelBE/YafQ-DinJ toxin-antitoxin module